MKLVKCPRCDLNYITEAEKYCKVCIREMKGSRSDDELELCSVCNAAPALPGKDVCLGCLKEMNDTSTDDNGNTDGRVAPDSASLSLDPVSDMDEIIPENEDQNEISLETVIEEENEDEDEQDRDDI